MNPSAALAQNTLDSIRKLFRYYRQLGTRALDQVDGDELYHEGAPGANSIAVNVKHMSSNMLSRWTDFLTADGEKPWRDRDDEFVEDRPDKQTLIAQWDRGWDCLFAAIDPLTGDNLDQIIYIRNEGHTVIEALHRQLAHYSYHVGQIVMLAKHIRGEEWQSLSIPRGGSSQFNAEKFGKEKERRHFFKE